MMFFTLRKVPTSWRRQCVELFVIRQHTQLLGVCFSMSFHSPGSLSATSVKSGWISYWKFNTSRYSQNVCALGLYSSTGGRTKRHHLAYTEGSDVKLPPHRKKVYILLILSVKSKHCASFFERWIFRILPPISWRTGCFSLTELLYYLSSFFKTWENNTSKSRLLSASPDI